MSSKRLFLRGLFLMSFVAIVVFGLELLGESSGLTGKAATNADMAGILSPVARAYNNILGMLLATIGFAIPLTANMHTPKLIDMFLRDRVNQVMLGASALGAAHVLWVLYLLGLGLAPAWAFRLAVWGAVLGWVALLPYFF
jgi:uncharacterized membrane protein